MNAYNLYPNYQPNYFGAVPQIQTPQPTPPQPSNGLVWVQGEAGAKSYSVSPGCTVLLMDSETNRFFLKSADASGMPMPLRVFDYDEKTEKKAGDVVGVEYATKHEFNDLKNAFKELYESVASMRSKVVMDNA